MKILLIVMFSWLTQFLVPEFMQFVTKIIPNDTTFKISMGSDIIKKIVYATTNGERLFHSIFDNERRVIPKYFPKNNVYIINDPHYLYMRIQNGHLHSKKKPAFMFRNNKFWYNRGLLHRDDGPAIVGKFRNVDIYYWYKNGVLHRDDGPAIETSDGCYCAYFKNGKLEDGVSVITPNFRGSIKDGVYHRDNEPAIQGKNVQIWIKNGIIHKENAPAVVYKNKTVYFLNGIIHRDDGPAYKIGTSQYWFKNGQLHREGEPAVIKRNEQKYYRNGLLHRDDGPAMITSTESIYYRNGVLHRIDGPAKIIRHRGYLDYWYYIHGSYYGYFGTKCNEGIFHKSQNPMYLCKI